MNPKISCLPVSLYPEFFSGARTVPAWSQQGAELGLDAVDINALFLQGKTAEEISDLRKQLTVPVLMVSAYSDFTNPDKTVREQALETALRDLQNARAIGAQYLRLTAGQAHPGETDADMIRRAYEGFARCAETAEQYQIEILLENHSKPGAWTYPDFNFHLERFLALWDAFKQLPVSINFDTANAYALHHWEQILHAVSGRIATIHLNDLASIAPLSFALVGQGIVPLETMVRAVKETGFSGPVCIEDASFLGWDGIARAFRYTRQLCRNVFSDL